MATGDAGSQLQSAKQALEAQWTQTLAIWRDNQASTFERVYIEPLRQASQAMVQEMQRLAQVLDEANSRIP